MKLAALFLALWLIAPAAGAHIDRPEQAIDFEQRLGQRLPLDTAFTDETGRPARLAARLGDVPVVLVLGYLRCSNLCDTTFAGVIEALRESGLRPGRDYRGLFVSIDPEDTASGSAAAKAERVPADQRDAWRFLTAGKASIRALADAVGFRYVYDPERLEYAHPAGFLVATPEGVTARYFLGVRFQPGEVRRAVIDAAGEKTGTLADRLLLLCYHLDAAGKRTELILDALRVAVALFLLGAGVLVWRASRRAAGGRAP
jgi:protein SCO1